MTKFKHIYIEITNICQFHCSFCPKSTRPAKFMSPSNFRDIIQQVNTFTDTIYLHVLGEPLIHPQLDELLRIANEYDLHVNLTTNGYALKETASILLHHHHIKKINISLHSIEDTGQQNLPMKDYIENIVSFANKAIVDIPTTITYRLWNTNTEHQKMMSFLQHYYQPDQDIQRKESTQNGTRLAYRVFLHQQNQFQWPIQSDQTQVSPNKGYCLGLKSHIAILVNGDVIPCCLDSEGILCLGNIFQDTLASILNTKKAQAMAMGFQQHIAVESFCRNCTYKHRFNDQDS